MFPLKDNIPTDRLPIVTILLIAANVLVYFVLQHGGIGHGPSNASVIDYGAIPGEVTGEQPDRGPLASYLTLVTAIFLHGGILHLAGNMLFLWIFGTNVEDAMSRPRYVLFYLLGGLCAHALQIALDPGSPVPTVGASGAIAAVLGGYIVLYPRARVVTVVFIVFLFTLIELPAWVLLGFWFVEQALFAAGQVAQPTADGGGGVAYAAHVGGFVFGLLAIRMFAQRRKRMPPPGRIPVYQ
ncbi:MAG TPA: rhomboid family intramembrane serine protease [Conexibacter sp.]|nr:rhomboid family intramembrane serine protease [Conexibacter sp.]